MFQFGMPTCQTVCHFFNLACQRGQRACQFFKHSSYEMLREISILYYYIKNSTLYILIHIMCVCILQINCIILYFLKLFCSLDRNWDIKTLGFYTLQLIVIYLCIQGKCIPWNYVKMTRDVRLFKVWRACFLHHKSISFTLARHKLSAHPPTNPVTSLLITPRDSQ